MLKKKINTIFHVMSISTNVLYCSCCRSERRVSISAIFFYILRHILIRNQLQHLPVFKDCGIPLKHIPIDMRENLISNRTVRLSVKKNGVHPFNHLQCYLTIPYSLNSASSQYPTSIIHGFINFQSCTNPLFRALKTYMPLFWRQWFRNTLVRALLKLLWLQQIKSWCKISVIGIFLNRTIKLLCYHGTCKILYQSLVSRVSSYWSPFGVCLKFRSWTHWINTLATVWNWWPCLLRY